MLFQNSDNLQGCGDQSKKKTHVQSYQVVPPEGLSVAMPDMQDKVLLLDFDETLWLRNSTEAFLAHVRPAWLVSLIVSFVMLQRPVARRLWPQLWINQKDWLRVWAVIVLMPWSLPLWRRHARAQKFGLAHQNGTLIDLVHSANPERIIVISNGFDPIVAPLMESLTLQVNQLVSAPLTTGFIWRGRGKSVNVGKILDAEALDTACFITDHVIDEDLLSRVGYGILCEWPEAEFSHIGLSFKRR